MKFEKKDVDGVVVVSVEGQLLGGPENADSFHRFFKSLLDDGKREIVVDLGNCAYASSQAVGMLMAVHASISKVGGELVFARVGDRVYDIFFVTGILVIFEVFDKVDDAVKYLTEKGSFTSRISHASRRAPEKPRLQPRDKDL